MTKSVLSEQRVRKIFSECQYQNNENPNDCANITVIIKKFIESGVSEIKGCKQAQLHLERLSKHGDEIIAMLNEILYCDYKNPQDSSQSIAITMQHTKSGELWTKSLQTVAQLFALGVGVGAMKGKLCHKEPIQLNIIYKPLQATFS